MKIQTLLLGTMICSSLTSCFKDEPLNAECDIEQAYVHVDNPADIFFAASDTLVSVPSDATDVVFEIKDGSDVSSMSPIFKLTEGATISPENGSAHDFSNGKTVAYTVTSQDGEWKKVYNVEFKSVYTVNNFDFEYPTLVAGPNTGQIYKWRDLGPDGSWIDNWATGNPGYNVSMGTAAPDDYPTVPVEDGHSGKGVKLTTLDTGLFGQSVNMRIAAGNLFIGNFDVSQALVDAMQATEFGKPFSQEPLVFSGWYKYKPGAKFQDRDGKEVADRTDIGDIYAVLYRNHDTDGNAFVLHGDDVLTSPQIVALARLPKVETTDEWTEFNINFEYYKDIDHELLENRGYNLAVVFTSSIDGASFKGAIGSTLYIDEVKIICADTNE